MAPTTKPKEAPDTAAELTAAGVPEADTHDATEAATALAEARKYDPRKLVYVYDSTSGKKLDRPVPETWLDGRFPQLSQTPSKKAGK